MTPVICQRRIGLTGGIASGKSSVARLLAERHQQPVLDADVYAREALAPGTAAAQEVVEHFGTLDRATLGQIVFSDQAQRQWLEQLVHPLVRARLETELARLAGEPVVVLMIPLLFEAGLVALCSETWLVDCNEDQQLERLMARNDLSEAEARSRIAAQWPLAGKRELATVVIDNRGSLEDLAVQVAQAISSGGAQPEDPPPTT